ncbi:MAG: sigma-70 family RNA polymerase sigma factor [Prevotellaceae bacterium]|jgi:RNA polymerase sigma-70 factor (ECF subfamily)|nr:sigma-70 family RNA polymerase sigma factor [Prevotellaceae bacterium]
MDDQLLIQGCLRGDLRAQKGLYEKYAPMMMGVCLRYAGDKELARDLMQDGFVRLFTRISTYSGSGIFAAWARKIFVNTALEHLRHDDALRFSDNIDEVAYLQDSDMSAIEQLSANELMKCMSELPDGFRTIFNMFAIEGYSHAEIAKELNINEGTSRSQYARARLLLQKKVEAMYGSSSTKIRKR